MVCTGRYTPTKADGERGALSVTATARARAPYDDPTVGDDDVVATTTQTVAVRTAPPPPTRGGGPIGTGR